MKQILQNLKAGKTEVAEVSAPLIKERSVLIKTNQSLISTGTERMLVEFGNASLINKARSQPEKVKKVLYKIKTDGLLPTLAAVFYRLDEPLPLGYSNVGEILEIGEGVTNFKPRDRVVSNGPHAEIVCVPKNLCARIPDNVSDEKASFTVVGSIGLQGIRLMNPTIGESIAVMGLGLIGLLAVQILISNGCRVLGFDFNDNKLKLARQFGAKTINLSKETDPVSAGIDFSKGNGIDAVLITASTRSSDPVHQAAQMCRKRGRIILVGVTGLKLSRTDFYEKELSFQVSCSYGPGRYDENYESKGQDYPFDFVRWTAQRNFNAVLDLISREKINTKPLISQVLPLEKAPEAYEILLKDKSQLGIILTYKDLNVAKKVIENPVSVKSAKIIRPVVGLIGAGKFASGVLIPIIKKSDAVLKTIASLNGLSATIYGRKYGFLRFTSDYNDILNDNDINTVFIATRHNNHAKLVINALNAGKNVFVEKPLALNREELRDIKRALLRANTQLLVGFNRRFSPYAEKMKDLLLNRSEPIAIIYTVNAGIIPPNHWVHDRAVGGGRIIGEACHFIDFLCFLVDKRIRSVQAQMMGYNSAMPILEDKMTINIEFTDGSIGTVHYFANGSRRFPKERVEVFSEGRILVLDNFKKLTGYGFKRFKMMKTLHQKKGHREEVDVFLDRVAQGGDLLLPWEVMESVTIATFKAVQKARNL